MKNRIKSTSILGTLLIIDLFDQESLETIDNNDAKLSMIIDVQLAY